MQANGVIHENGTSTSEFAVNGLGGVVKSNGCENVSCEEEGGLGVGGASGHVAVPLRKRKHRQLSSKDTDIIRLIGQHLREMGFNNTLASLVEESGCPLEHPKASTFRNHVIAGEWDEANKSLNDLVPLLEDASNVEKMRLLLLREKYLELLESGREMEALHCLRHELAPVPLHHSDKQLQLLTSYMMYSDKELLRKAADWPGLRGGAREQLMDKLQGFLSSSVMLPPKRLQQLLSQAVQLQIDKCPFHYMDMDTSECSLLTDHICTRAQFPSETVHILTDHSEEVWYVKFSHNGSMLASASKDGHAIIWDVSGGRPVKRLTLKAQSDGIAIFDWSPDDSLLLCCGKDDNPEAIVFSTSTGEVKCRVNHSSDDNLTCCAWHNNGTNFYVGGTRGQFLECSMDGSVTATWEGIRVQAIATHPNSDNVYAADTHNRIRQYNFHDKSSSTLVIENHSIMSFRLSRNGRNALLNVATQGIHLWDLQDRCLLRHYQGITQSLYAIYSCYGGVSENFLASGSEDHHVYVWLHSRETPVVILKGHSHPVNCVDWNSANPTMLASGSDDGTVRIWGTEEQMRTEQCYQRERIRLGEQVQQDSMHEMDPLLGSSSVSHASRSRDGDNMEVQPSDTTPDSSSDPDPHPSELERLASGASSLSLSNLRPVILEALGPRRDSSDSASSWSLSALDETASRVHFSSLDFGSPRFVRGGSGTTISVGGGSGSGSRMRLHVTLMQDSMEQEASQLSQDSSNGSVSQPDDEDQSLSLASDTSLRFGRSGGSSGGLDSPTTASTPVAGGGPGIVGGGSSGMLLTTTTPTPTPTPPGPGRGLGTSVIVGGSGSSGRTAGEATPRDGGSGASGSGSPLQGAVSAAHSTSTLAEEEQGIQQATSQGDSSTA